jgi:hypothetical protein
MTERSFEDAVRVLRDRMGGRWDGIEGEGRDEMVRLLKHELGYDSSQANSAIDAMLRSGQIRYHRGRAAGATDPSEPPPASPVLGGPQTTNTNLPGAPVQSGEDFGPGFWEIGGAGEAPAGRAGQVQPS